MPRINHWLFCTMVMQLYSLSVNLLIRCPFLVQMFSSVNINIFLIWLTKSQCFFVTQRYFGTKLVETFCNIWYFNIFRKNEGLWRGKWEVFILLERKSFHVLHFYYTGFWFQFLCSSYQNVSKRHWNLLLLANCIFYSLSAFSSFDLKS